MRVGWDNDLGVSLQNKILKRLETCLEDYSLLQNGIVSLVISISKFHMYNKRGGVNEKSSWDALVFNNFSLKRAFLDRIDRVLFSLSSSECSQLNRALISLQWEKDIHQDVVKYLLKFA